MTGGILPIRTASGRSKQALGFLTDGLFTGQFFERNETMSAFQEHKEELEHYEQMFGRERGRLAVSLDRITNALVLAGQHGVYCTSQRNPAVPAMDLRMIHQELVHAKELVQSVMEELRQAKKSPKD